MLLSAITLDVITHPAQLFFHSHCPPSCISISYQSAVFWLILWWKTVAALCNRHTQDVQHHPNHLNHPNKWSSITPLLGRKEAWHIRQGSYVLFMTVSCMICTQICMDCTSVWKSEKGKINGASCNHARKNDTCVLQLCVTSVCYTCVLHLCATPVCYTCVLHPCATPVCYICVLHLCATPMCYTRVLHLCATPVCYTCVLHLCICQMMKWRT